MSVAGVEGYLNELVLDVSKAVLRHPDLELFHEDDTELYLYLYVYFQRLATQQHHEDAIAITTENVRQLLHGVLLRNLAGTRAIPSVPPAELSAGGREKELYLWWRATHMAPMVQQRVLREQLTQLKLNVAAFGEVVEMCRYIDEMQRAEQGASAAPAPFGSVNLLHFVAVFMTLAPTRTLFDLISVLFLEVDVPQLHPTRHCLPQQLLNDAIKVKILHCWALVDRTNRDALEAVCNTLAAHPNLTLPLLLELHPSAKAISTAEYIAPPSVASSGTSGLTTQHQGSQVRVVAHTEDEEPVDLLAALGQMPPCSGDEGEEVGDEGCEPHAVHVQRSAEEEQFWAQLVS